MKNLTRNNTIKMIPVHEVYIPNPRVRNKKQYREIAENVVQVGLKRPITVTTSKSGISGKNYDLVCGQGRLEIFIACGQKEIPAMVIVASEEEVMVMSIVENMARRQHNPMDLMKGIELLRNQGYGIGDISKKTGLAWPYVRDISNLIEKGEERLISAVESGIIPISLAALIADSPGEEQQALQDAYENKSLRGKRLLLAKKLIEERNMRGKSMRKGPASRQRTNVASAQDVIQAYQQNVNKKRILVRKSEMVNNNLIFIVEALRQMYTDDNFKNLLKAEGLTSFPKPIADMIKQKGNAHV
jgi:ParB family chromosome partitioning protein